MTLEKEWAIREEIKKELQEKMWMEPEKTDGGIQGNNNNEVYRSGIFLCKISPVVEKETQVRLS